MCEILEQRNKAKEDLNGRNNEIQNQSLQHENLIDQISNANEEIMSLRLENERIRNDLNFERQINERKRSEMRSEKKISERLKNDLNIEKQVNERMMKSQAYMKQLNQLNEGNLYRKKGKARLGYKDEGESSKQGAQKNQRPTRNHCGKIGHMSNKCWSN